MAVRKVKLWNEYKTLSEDRLVALCLKRDSFYKVNSKRIDDALLPILFFYYFAKELKGISGTWHGVLRGQSRALTVWSAGSFVQEKNREAKNKARREVMKEAGYQLGEGKAF